MEGGEGNEEKNSGSCGGCSVAGASRLQCGCNGRK